MRADEARFAPGAAGGFGDESCSAQRTAWSPTLMVVAEKVSGDKPTMSVQLHDNSGQMETGPTSALIRMPLKTPASARAVSGAEEPG